MRRFISAVLLGALLLSQSFSANARDFETRSGGEDVPIPLNYPLPFPWGTIEGIWETVPRSEDTVRDLFSFEVQKDENGRKILKVVHINPQTQEIQATGTAISIDNSYQVSAAMGGRYGTYMAFIGLFRSENTINAERYHVLTVRSFSDPNDKGFDLVIKKIAPSPVRSPTELGAGKNVRSKSCK